MEQEHEVRLQGVVRRNKRARARPAGGFLWVPKQSRPNLVQPLKGWRRFPIMYSLEKH